MTEPLWTDDQGPIKNVRKDMPVFDAVGQEVGRVEFVKMGDPDAVTGEGQLAPSRGVLGALRRLIGGGEPGTSNQLAQHLTRVGFVKVDGTGLLDHDAYVAADQVDQVVDDAVHLSVRSEELVGEL